MGLHSPAWPRRRRGASATEAYSGLAAQPDRYSPKDDRVFRFDPLRQAPSAALALGIAGLLPFATLALLAAAADTLSDHLNYQFLLTGYAAVILSFVGAIHWGIAMMLPRIAGSECWRWMGWSVLPALVGWLCIIASPGIALPALVAAFWLHLYQDRSLHQRHPLPVWYPPLRLGLTMVVTIFLLVAWLV